MDGEEKLADRRSVPLRKAATRPQFTLRGCGSSSVNKQSATAKEEQCGKLSIAQSLVESPRAVALVPGTAFAGDEPSAAAHQHPLDDSMPWLNIHSQ